MKDIYTSMAGQDILHFYNLKLDIKIDMSEVFDFTIDNSGENIDDFIVFNKKPLFQIQNTRCDNSLLTQDVFLILTQNDECLQFQF